MRQFLTAVAAVVLLTGIVWADDEKSKDAPKDKAAAEKAAMRERVAKYLENGIPGVLYSEDADTKDGRFLRVFVVGTASISTVLGAEEGIEIAQEKAEESAKTLFVTWLGSKVSVQKTTKNELLITKVGEEGGDGIGTSKESAKKVERRTKEFEEVSSSLIRGLKVVASQQKGKEKKLVIVYRWDGRLAAAIGEVKEGLNTKPDEKKPTEKKPPKPENKEIPDKKVIIDD